MIYQAGVSNGQTWKSAEDAEAWHRGFFPVCKSSRALEAARLRQDAAWNSWKDIADGMMKLVLEDVKLCVAFLLSSSSFLFFSEVSSHKMRAG